MNAAAPLRFFREITQIPRDSGDERRVTDYLLAFARQRGLTAHRDSALNVVIRKPGTPGMEQRPVLTLQSHVDMVYIKAQGCPHEYASPLALVEEEGWLRADGTSLGADNGTGMAFALALLDSADLPHPPLEALFTTDEEVGMHGARALSADMVTGRRMLNMDSEEDDVFTAGCAGGLHVNIAFQAGLRDTAAGSEGVLLQVQGLRGGHSGIEIDKGRGNAICLMGRLLYTVQSVLPVQVCAVSGGSKMNAIPDRAQAMVAVSPADLPAFGALVDRCHADYFAELSTADPDLSLALLPATAPARALAPDSLDRLLLLLLNLPIGPQSMSRHLPGLVESSNNMGMLRSGVDGAITISCAVRSMVGSLRTAIADQIDTLARAAGATTEPEAAYPPWTFQPDSPFRARCAELYRELFGESPKVGAIHAGLECGFFKELIPDLEIVSFGAVIKGAHTPREMLDLRSMERVWRLLCHLARHLDDVPQN